MESSTTNHQAKVKEIDELIESMSKLQGMEDMMWYHSPTNSHKVVLFGVTAQAEENIKDLEARFPEFCFEVKPKPNLLTEQLARSSSLVVNQETHSSEPIDVPKESTCGLLLEGDSPGSDGTSTIYALTCAHLLFTESQCIQLLKDKDPSEIQELRDTKIDPPLVHRSYQLKLLPEYRENRKTFDLESRPIYFYRHYTSVGRQHEDGTIRCHQNKCTLSSIFDKCTHDYFMNDILLLPLKSDSVSQLKQSFLEQHSDYFSCRYDSIKDTFQKPGDTIYVGDGSYQVWDGLNCSASRGRRYAKHLMFIAANGKRFTPGDSGSIVHVRQNDKKDAIAVLIGHLRSDKNIYQAVYLKPAIEDIEKQYSDSVQNLRLVDPLSDSRAANGGHQHLSQFRSSTTVRPPSGN